MRDILLKLPWNEIIPWVLFIISELLGLYKKTRFNSVTQVSLATTKAVGGKFWGWTLIVLIFLFVGCSCIPHISDNSFMVSAQANSAEFPIKINGKDCKDINGQMGICAVSLPNGIDIAVDHAVRPYNYRLAVICTESANLNTSRDVLKNSPHKLILQGINFQHLALLYCEGEIFPDDRKDVVSMKWKLLVNLVDPDYIKREEAYVANGQVVFGQHALHTYYNEKYFPKGTVVKEKVGAKGNSESFSGRFNYVGY